MSHPSNSHLFQIWRITNYSFPIKRKEEYRQKYYCKFYDCHSNVFDAVSLGCDAVWMGKWFLLFLVNASPTSSKVRG